jgi:hypothetical protein
MRCASVVETQLKGLYMRWEDVLGRKRGQPPGWLPAKQSNGTRRQTERRQRDRPVQDDGYSHLVTVHLAAEGGKHKETIIHLASRFLILMEKYISIRI